MVLALVALCAWGALVKQATLNTSPGRLTQALNEFVSFPETVAEVLGSRELRGIPATCTPVLDIDPVNRLDYDVYGLNAFLGDDRDFWEIRLFNFRNDEVIHRWRFYRRDFVQTDQQFANSEPRNSVLLPGRSLIANCDQTNNLYRLDRDSRIVWHNTSRRFHHSLNPDPDSNLWVCTSRKEVLKTPAIRQKLFYRDNYITKVDPATGKILYEKSVSEILLEHGYANFLFGCANRLTSQHQVGGWSDYDPLHINDIEPVFEDGPYWKRGDLFLSLRHRSLVIHYRPASDRIVRLIYGPFLNQHDVDILSDHEIAIFNNNRTSIGQIVSAYEEEAKREVRHELEGSGLVVCDLRDGSFRRVLEPRFREEQIYTETQGFMHRVSTGDYYVESQNQGLMYFMNEDGILYRKQFPPVRGEWTERPHWIRIYEDIDF
jgi:hypothetical protein